MRSADHENEVEQLGADRADEPLGESVGLRGADRGPHHPSAFERNTSSKEAVNFESRSRIRNRSKPPSLIGARPRADALWSPEPRSMMAG